MPILIRTTFGKLLQLQEILVLQNKKEVTEQVIYLFPIVFNRTFVLLYWNYNYDLICMATSWSCNDH